MENIHTIRRPSLDSARLLWLTSVCALLVHAHPRAADIPPVPRSPVRVAAVQARSVIVIDGVLAEPAWSTPPAANFLQRDPNEGAPPTESTEARILYDNEALYVGVRLFDRNAGQVGRRLSRRDDEPDADAVQVYLDPRRDGRSGAMFEVTAAGVQRDALIFNDASLDFSWDAVWDSAVTIDKQGWTVEIRIPFSQLRFPSEGASAWGLNIARYIRRKNETDWLVLVPKRETHLAARMAELTGLSGIRPTSRMEVVSHVATREVSAVKTSPTPGALVGALGVDGKAGIGSNLTVDATVNPDFAQVESDPAVVNLTAFETFLEERRPFFTESAPLFQTFGNPGGAFDASTPLLFYSRRIGQAPPESGNVAPLNQPTATPVLGAVKLSGGVGQHWKVAFMDAVSGATTAPSTLGSTSPAIETAPVTNYAAARLLHTTDRGGFGTLATVVARNLSDSATPGTFVPKRALVGGADGYVFVDQAQEWVVGGQVSASHLSWTPVVPSSASAGATAAGSAAAAVPPAAAIDRVIDLTIARAGPRSTNPSKGPPSTNPGKGPPSTNPGKGPPSTNPGKGPPSTNPGKGPPSTNPGEGPPSSVPGVGPPTRGPGAGVGPVAGVSSGSGGARGEGENTGPNRALDLSQGRLDGWSANANLHRNSGAVRVNVDTWAISPGFEVNDLGFLPRADIQGLQGQVSWSKFDPDGLTRYRSVGVIKGWTRTFTGERQSDSIDVWTSATFLNYWSASGGTSRWRQAFDATLTRGGPSVWTPAGRSWWVSAGTDPRNVISLDGGAFHGANDLGDRSSSGWTSVTVKPASSVTVSIGPTIDRTDANAQYVATVDGSASAGRAATPHYVFASLRANEVALTTRLNVMATSRLSFQVYAQAFVASGQYTGFKELAKPASNQFFRYGADAGSLRYDSQTGQYVVQVNSGSATFRFDNPDFNPALLDVHAVVRWEWRRGSTLYLVWTQRRSGAAGLEPVSLPGLNRAFDAPADNAVAAKFTYWLGR